MSIAVTAAVLAAALAPTPAQATLSAVGPVNPATGYPDWYQDANGLKLQLCVDGPPYCLAAAADLVPPEGEAFWWQAESDVAVDGGTALLTLAMEAAYLANDPITFGRVRVTVRDAAPSTTYAVTHPYGTASVTNDALGNERFNEDIGCGDPPCNWSRALSSSIGPFLTWTPGGTPPPAGHVGDAVTPHTVTGSPNNFNAFRIGGAQTNLFTVQGKLAGPPVPVFNAPGALDFGSNVSGVPTTRTVTVRSFGVPAADGSSNLTVAGAAISGPNAGEFGIVGNTCAGTSMPSGASRDITVAFAPGAPGAKTAALDVANNAAGGTRSIPLGGTSTAPPPAPAPAAAAGRTQAAGVAGTGARSLRLQALRMSHRVSRARVLRRGLRLTMRLAEGTEIVRVAIYRTRGRRRESRPVYETLRVAPARAGLYRLTLDGRALRQRLKVGRYQLNVTPGAGRRELGRTTTTFFRVTSR